MSSRAAYFSGRRLTPPRHASKIMPAGTAALSQVTVRDVLAATKFALYADDGTTVRGQ